MMQRSFTRRMMLWLPALALPAIASRAADPEGAAMRPPAPTLRPAARAASGVDVRGFIRRWRVHEPVATNGRLAQSDIEKVLRDLPYASQASTPSHLLDTTRYNFNLYHFAWALSKPTSNVLFWVTTTLEVPADLVDVRLSIGSNAASAWWLDEERLVSLYNDRQTVIDDGVSRRLTLRKGRHSIRAAIINGGGATDFCARFLRADGEPVTGLVASAA